MAQQAEMIDECLQDRLAIHELLDSYAQLVNRREWPSIGTIFAADAEWHVLCADEPRRIVGNHAVAAAIEAAVERYAVFVQMNDAPLIEVQGDRAVATSILNETGTLDEGRDLYLLGNYHDQIARIDGRWKFTKRTFRTVYMDVSGLVGTA
jgi:ketosteroid isomerase-like protein